MAGRPLPTTYEELDYAEGKKKAIRSNPYPGPAEVKFAKDMDAYYGTGLETIIGLPKKKKNIPTLQQVDVVDAPDKMKDMMDYLYQDRTKNKYEKKVTPRLAEAIGEAALAKRRSAISSLGFSPEGTVYGQDLGYGSVQGFSARRKGIEQGGRMFSTYSGESGDVENDSTITHETIHKGLAKLALLEGADKGAILSFGPVGALQRKYKDLPYVDEEQFVRWVMMNKMGNPDKNVPEDNKPLLSNSDWTSTVPVDRDYNYVFQKLENLASKQIAKRNPGGPR